MKLICNVCRDPCKLNAKGAGIAPDCCPFRNVKSKWEKRKPKAKKPAEPCQLKAKKPSDEPCQYPVESLYHDYKILVCHKCGNITVLYPDGQWSDWHKPEDAK